MSSATPHRVDPPSQPAADVPVSRRSGRRGTGAERRRVPGTRNRPCAEFLPGESYVSEILSGESPAAELGHRVDFPHPPGRPRSEATDNAPHPGCPTEPGDLEPGDLEPGDLESGDLESGDLDHPHPKQAGCDEPDSAAEFDSADDWLRLHATDLIDRLQSWASDLDARESQLNARASLQDHRERCFRLQQQDVATELAEQQRSIERLRQESEAQARRLAFADEPADP